MTRLERYLVGLWLEAEIAANKGSKSHFASGRTTRGITGGNYAR